MSYSSSLIIEKNNQVKTLGCHPRLKVFENIVKRIIRQCQVNA